MSIDRLVEEGSVHKFQASSEEIDRAMSLARRDLTFAGNAVNESLDWSYSIAYNAVLQACRAYMFHHGYRPAANESHKATLRFMHIASVEPLKGAATYFDRVRKKRHRTVYDEVGIVTEKEARQLLRKAEEFISRVDSILKEREP